MNIRVFVCVAIASLAGVTVAEVVMIDHNTVQPFAEPYPTSEAEKSAIKYKPQLRISYGCHPYPVVQADGALSAGLNWAGWAHQKCKGSGLGSQIYSRSDWYKGKWAIMYAWYFPRRRQRSGHRIIWTDSSSPDNSTLLGVSGVGYMKRVPPKPQYVIDNTTVKLDSYNSFWGNKQGIRLSEKAGDTQNLITWDQLSNMARTALTEANFDVKWSAKNVVMPLKDHTFMETLKKAYPF
ncbi:hypothetical protein PInf_005026 [Phytophthora infestans]|nr:hypothetical protein PInf_005026 [Phytophthora infestans]